MKKQSIKFSVQVALFAFSILFTSAVAWASMKELKAYKEAYPDEKPKCSYCHTTATPKKDDGQHDLNEYGKKVTAIKAEPDVETFKAAGK